MFLYFQVKKLRIVPLFVLKYKRVNGRLDPFINLQVYYQYGEDKNYEMAFKDRLLWTAIDIWCKIQVTCTQYDYISSWKN